MDFDEGLNRSEASIRCLTRKKSASYNIGEFGVKITRPSTQLVVPKGLI